MSASLPAHGSTLERRGIGDHDEIAATLHLRHGEAAAGGEHRIDGLCAVSLASNVVVMVTPARISAGASAATTVLPRSTPC